MMKLRRSVEREGQAKIMKDTRNIYTVLVRKWKGRLF
jgi:hypothetical protein